MSSIAYYHSYIGFDLDRQKGLSTWLPWFDGRIKTVIECVRLSSSALWSLLFPLVILVSLYALLLSWTGLRVLCLEMNPFDTWASAPCAVTLQPQIFPYIYIQHQFTIINNRICEPKSFHKKKRVNKSLNLVIKKNIPSSPKS